MISKIMPILMGITLSLMQACDAEDAASSAAKITALFENQSQFTVESLYLHDSALNYAGQTNLLSLPLQPGESIQDEIPALPWYVTVFRKPNQDSSVLAYTTAQAWDPAEFPRIIYFDEQFRVSRD